MIETLGKCLFVVVRRGSRHLRFELCVADEAFGQQQSAGFFAADVADEGAFFHLAVVFGQMAEHEMVELVGVAVARALQQSDWTEDVPDVAVISFFFAADVEAEVAGRKEVMGADEFDAGIGAIHRADGFASRGVWVDIPRRQTLVFGVDDGAVFFRDQSLQRQGAVMKDAHDGLAFLATFGNALPVVAVAAVFGGEVGNNCFGAVFGGDFAHDVW